VVTAEMLAHIPLFARLSPEGRAALAREMRERHYPKGAVVFSAGDPGEAAYIVVSGRVKVYRLSPDGTEQLMGIFGPGQPFGLVPALDRSPYPATAETTLDTRVWIIRNEHLQKWMTGNPAFAADLMRVVGHRLRRAQSRVHSLATLSVHQRLAEYLLQQVEDQESGDQPAVRIRLAMTHQELGNYLGASRETVTRALADLRREGAVQVHEGDELLVYPDRLQTILHA
jgi:CRP/FNR family cyclic AMP-dependent transcriptional regulator